jgi:hypothetical protein
MKKILLCIIVATIPYCIFLNATARQVLMDASDSELSSLNSEIEVNWDKIRTPIRPLLNPDFEKLPDKDRVGLRGPVKSVRTNSAEFIEKDDQYKRTKISPNYEEDFYDTSGGRFKVETNRRLRMLECGNGPPPPPIKEVYNDKGLLIAEIYFSGKNASIKTKTLYTYDDDGNILTDSKFDGDGFLKWMQVYEYKLDSYGNWIEKIPVVVVGGDKRDIVQGYYRRITYYKK